MAESIKALVDAILEGCAAIARDAKAIERHAPADQPSITRGLLMRTVRHLAHVQPGMEAHAVQLLQAAQAALPPAPCGAARGTRHR